MLLLLLLTGRRTPDVGGPPAAVAAAAAALLKAAGMALAYWLVVRGVAGTLLTRGEDAPESDAGLTARPISLRCGCVRLYWYPCCC